MYCIEEIFDDVRQKLGYNQWPSEAHEIVVRNVCLNNPNVCTMETLQNNIRIILQIPNDKIMTISASDIQELGCVF